MDREVEDLLSSEVNKIYGRCRCCLELTYVKNMWTEYTWKGAQEIYGEMLMETFSIAWDTALNDKEQICDACVSRLRDAHFFKREVLASDELLKEGLLDSEVESIKEERLSDLDQYENTTEDALQDPEYKQEEITFKEEFVTEEVEYEQVEYLDEENIPDMVPDAKVSKTSSGESSKQAVNRPRRKRKQGLNTRNYKNYTEHTLRQSIKTALTSDMSIAEVALMYGVPRKTLTARVLNAKKKPKPDDPVIASDEESSRNGKQKPNGKHTRKKLNSSEANKYRDNVKTILAWSNATPFKTHGSDYVCCFCDEEYSSTGDLKRHSLTHPDKCHENKVKSLCDFSLRLDITDLECLVCYKNIASLEHLITHLQNHGKLYHTDIKNEIIPYKFDTDQFKCTQCDLVFKYFKLLCNHMSEHYRNYVCDVCCKAFVNKSSLRKHEKRHIIGEYNCGVCPKKFVTKERRDDHQRVVHVYSSKAYKCWKCDLFFLDADKKAEHDVESHGAEPQIFDCNACKRTFKTRRAVRIHVNNYHLMRKPHSCSECGKMFSQRSRLERHMLKHVRLKTKWPMEQMISGDHALEDVV